MKVLVTGGCGFIGSHFVRLILDTYPEYTVINLDSLNYAGGLDTLRDIENDARYTFVRGDIRDQALTKELVSNVDAVVNFAAQTHVDRSITAARDFIETNINGTFTLLEAMRGSKAQRFIQISTDEVYGSRGEGSFTEKDLLEPSSPYSASKAAADLICHGYRLTYEMPIIVVRSVNNFGPFQFPEKVIPLFITNILEEKKVPLYGDGLHVRDWIYVVDNAKAIDYVLHNGVDGEMYNISVGNELPNIELTKEILARCSVDESWIEPVKDRPAHDRRYSIDSSKLRALGWVPHYSFQEALGATINWYKENQWWWKKRKQS